MLKLNAYTEQRHFSNLVLTVQFSPLFQSLYLALHNDYIQGL